MKSKILFLFIFVLFCVTPSFGSEKNNAVTPISYLRKGMTRTEIRRKLGNPMQMRGNIWKYHDFFLIFQAGLLDCAVKSECFGKWNDCHSFRKRSKDCLLVK